MFETFVDPKTADEAQIGNLVAYALYKRAKAEWTRAIRKDFNRAPTQEELTAYHRTWSKVQVDAVRASAWSALSRFGESFVDDARPAILKDALRGKALADILKAIAANIAYTLFLIALVLVLRWSGVDVLGLLEKASPTKAEVQGVGPAPRGAAETTETK